MQTKKTYAKRMGMAGEILCHSQGALYAVGQSMIMTFSTDDIREDEEKDCG